MAEFFFAMEHYEIKEPQLCEKQGCLLLSKPYGYDLSGFFPEIWRSPSVSDAQQCLPHRCTDEMLITTAERNGECRQLTFVQNYFKQSQEYQHDNAKDFAEDLRKNLSISTLSLLLFSNFEIYVVKSGAMPLFSKGKEENRPITQALLWEGSTLKLSLREGRKPCSVLMKGIIWDFSSSHECHSKRKSALPP